MTPLTARRDPENVEDTFNVPQLGHQVAKLFDVRDLERETDHRNAIFSSVRIRRQDSDFLF